VDNTIFKKLRAKPGMTAAIICACENYPDYEWLTKKSRAGHDFVHLFISNKAEFEQRFKTAADITAEGGLLWVSYPKSDKNKKYDINRDSLWRLAIAAGWHPVAQVSLDEKWSAVRMRPNEPGVVYEHPKNVKPNLNPDKPKTNEAD